MVNGHFQMAIDLLFDQMTIDLLMAIDLLTTLAIDLLTTLQVVTGQKTYLLKSLHMGQVGWKIALCANVI